MAKTYRICGVRETDPGQTASADSTLHVTGKLTTAIHARAFGRAPRGVRARAAARGAPLYVRLSLGTLVFLLCVAACTPFFGTVYRLSFFLDFGLVHA
jgi:hypothetical protein